MAILSFAQQKGIKPISDNNQTKYAQIAGETEQNDLQKLIGIALLQDLQTNPATVNNVKLLDGDTFINCEGFSVKTKGLRYVIAYLNYVRYINYSFVSDNFTGFTKKTHPDSTVLSEGELNRIKNDCKEIALTEFELIKDYLIQNATNYPLFTFCSNKQKPYTPRIFGVRNTQKGNKINYDNVPVSKCCFPKTV